MYMGIDIGSSFGKAICLNDDGDVIARVLEPTGLGGKQLANKIRQAVIEQIGQEPTYAVATGYGRINVPFADKTVTEISCHARGVNHLYNECKVVVDIGGQDSKVIVLGPKGSVADFVMNDKCAAGTGRFLDVMARALEVEVTDLGDLHYLSDKRLEISSTCAVFAESEVISLLAQGEAREDIVAGLHRAITNRVYSLLRGRVRGSSADFLVLTGGVARNKGIADALTEKVGAQVHVPDEPQFTGALGAAVIASELKLHKEGELQGVL